MFERLVKMGLPFVRLNYQVCVSASINVLILSQDQSIKCRHVQMMPLKTKFRALHFNWYDCRYLCLSVFVSFLSSASHEA